VWNAWNDGAAGDAWKFWNAGIAVLPGNAEILGMTIKHVMRGMRGVPGIHGIGKYAMS